MLTDDEGAELVHILARFSRESKKEGTITHGLMCLSEATKSIEALFAKHIEENHMNNDDIMALVFTNHQCRVITAKIEESGTQDDDLLLLKNAMRHHAAGIATSPFMAYIYDKDDEILPGFKLTDHSMRVDSIIDYGEMEWN